MEVQTYTGHSITFNMFLHFVTLTFRLKNLNTCRISQGHSPHRVRTLWDHLFIELHTDHDGLVG